ncbi:hypothetical protein JHK87_007097 [Glycine soja]|nr:hypothetical protein JHK87_007097 [Glycine soja]
MLPTLPVILKRKTIFGESVVETLPPLIREILHCTCELLRDLPVAPILDEEACGGNALRGAKEADLCCAYANQTSTTLVVDASKSGRQIPDTLFGIFFEEINHAGAGGLWAELVNNRGFEAGGTQVPSNIAPWTIVGQESAILLQTELSSCFERNKVALRMDVLCDNCPSDGVGVSNPGFWGMEALDGIEFARGEATSKWGSLRASMGHPKPFDLKYVAIGNEDSFYEAIRHAYPDIQMISNCDASSKPLDHPADMYDYHAFVSEYALIGDIQAKHGTLLGAVSEAGFLIGLERNRWSPAAIVFNSNQVYGTPSYWVQFMFRESNGATFLKSQLQTPDPDSVAASAILWKNLQDKKTYLKIKVANVGSNQINFKISLNGFESSNATKATKTVLTSKNALDENSLANPTNIVPKRSPLQSANNEINDILPPVSLTVFDLLKNE